MEISDFQVQSVLRTYSRQLLRTKLTSPSEQDAQPFPVFKVSISEVAQQHLLMDRIRSQAMEQINRQQEDTTK
jgi:hypothetical protein